MFVIGAIPNCFIGERKCIETEVKYKNKNTLIVFLGGRAGEGTVVHEVIFVQCVG